MSSSSVGKRGRHNFPNGNRRGAGDVVPEAEVVSLLDKLPEDLLQNVCKFTPSLNDIYNMRCAFKAAIKVENEALRRAVVNRDAASRINLDMCHKNDHTAKDVKCCKCKCTLPPVRGFSLVSRCSFPYCLTENAIRPAAPLPNLAVPLFSNPMVTIMPGQILLTARRGPAINGATVIIRHRQFHANENATGLPWKLHPVEYRHSHATMVASPGFLDSNKLVEFSCAVRIRTCTCPLLNNTTSVPASVCYANHKECRKCDAVWTPWSAPSVPVYPPNVQEVAVFRRKFATVYANIDNDETDVSSENESNSSTMSEDE